MAAASSDVLQARPTHSRERSAQPLGLRKRTKQKNPVTEMRSRNAKTPALLMLVVRGTTTTTTATQIVYHAASCMPPLHILLYWNIRQLHMNPLRMRTWAQYVPTAPNVVVTHLVFPHLMNPSPSKRFPFRLSPSHMRG